MLEAACLDRIRRLGGKGLVHVPVLLPHVLAPVLNASALRIDRVWLERLVVPAEYTPLAHRPLVAADLEDL